MKIKFKIISVAGFFLFFLLNQTAHSKKYIAVNDYNYPPYNFLNDNGEPGGFIIELLENLGKETKTEYSINLKSWDESLAELKQGKADLIPGIFYTPERDKYMDFSLPTVIIYHSVFTRKNEFSVTSLDDIAGKKILCQRSDIIHDYLLSKTDKKNIIPVDTQEHALLLLASGLYDLAIIGEMQGLYFIKKNNLTNLAKTGSSVLPFNYCLAVKQGDKKLLSILNQGIMMLKKNGEYDRIFSKWFLPDQMPGSTAKYFLLSLSALLTLILIISSWTITLRKKVSQKTEELQQELELKKKIMLDLEQNNIFLTTLLETVPTPVFYKDLNGRYIGCNASYGEFMGIMKEDILFKTLHNIANPDVAEFHIQKEKELIETGTPMVYESIIIDGEKNIHNALFHKALYPDSTGKICGIIGVIVDITETKDIQNKLRESLHEKEILLKEVHHRVKNNLQIISSLLNLQALKIKDENTVKQFQSSRNRIYTMALIHEKLYQTGNFSRVDLIDYIEELIVYLSQTYSVNHERITFSVKGSGINLNINQAIPCGMIINEIITNALKHAFPESFTNKGLIEIIMNIKEDRLEISISDNGIGFPDDFDMQKAKSLGFQLIRNIISHQLKGNLVIKSARENTGYVFDFEVD